MRMLACVYIQMHFGGYMRITIIPFEMFQKTQHHFTGFQSSSNFFDAEINIISGCGMFRESLQLLWVWTTVITTEFVKVYVRVNCGYVSVCMYVMFMCMYVYVSVYGKNFARMHNFINILIKYIIFCEHNRWSLDNRNVYLLRIKRIKKWCFIPILLM